MSPPLPAGSALRPSQHRIEAPRLAEPEKSSNPALRACSACLQLLPEPQRVAPERLSDAIPLTRLRPADPPLGSAWRSKVRTEKRGEGDKLPDEPATECESRSGRETQEPSPSCRRSLPFVPAGS